ncbi:MAG: hypothetical protein GTO45_10705 [Candidatus Aminicenantes bacterium]|nr:hypothetical protein [Candidatus Aminicenantes bacterium]NIM79276.1 hypothetical protein [Candidatus Aminicenantes bacterium]NIN18562.1 hypothetical protein [Candidatus Aminicenantes bacterium]NIN42459.1 hypothetical protein [Candidatus Aminicenantes bacterium]NIN85217.1 hypothetical protein [Candidatus Aminicenantes bacterium]
MKCFLSCSFREEDKYVVNWFRDFLSAFHDIEIIVARDGIKEPKKQIEDGIRDCDFFCSIVTKRKKSVPPYILSEIGMAHSNKKMVIAFVEERIPIADLGILPEITEFKNFRRDKLGIKAPEYLRYINNARCSILKKLSRDRTSLMKEIGSLKSKMDSLEYKFNFLIDHYSDDE